MKGLLRTILQISFLLLAAGCTGSKTKESNIQERKPENAVYYWKTRFDLGDAEKGFLKDNDITRIYLRYFDVDFDSNPVSRETGVVPVGTLSFNSPRPEGIEIVPTVFITVSALSYIRDNQLVQDLADKIVQRVLNMSSYNEMGKIPEMQLDCDWTGSTQETYFSLCRAVKGLLKESKTSLSATIRLHQLRLPAPPVDRGVLMLYNTGAMRDPSSKNSILDPDDVKLYLKGEESRYKLPLGFAYPTYSWGLWFRDGAFMGILHQNEFIDTTRYSDSNDGTFVVCKEHILENHHLIPGDIIRLESSTMSSIKETAELVRIAFPGEHDNIIYHLDMNNLKHFSQDEIKEIYNY